MVIQRWQSVMLLLAVVVMCIFCANPFAVDQLAGTAVPVMPKDAPVFLILNIVIAVLLFLSIFMYKNLRRQMQVTIIAMVLTVASMATCGIIIWTSYPEAKIIWAGGILDLAIVLLFSLLAYRFMDKDRKLLRSYDRLR